MMQAEPGIPRRCSIFPGRAPQPPRPSRRWGAGAALVVLVAVLGIATPEDAQAQGHRPWGAAAPQGLGEQCAGNTELVRADGRRRGDHHQYTNTAMRRATRCRSPPCGLPSNWMKTCQDGADVTCAGGKGNGADHRLTGTQYTFEVRAVNSAGEGPAATLTATVERLPIELSWDAREARLEPSFTLTITFSEAVTGFTLDDIIILTNSESDGSGVQSSAKTTTFQGSGRRPIASR